MCRLSLSARGLTKSMRKAGGGGTGSSIVGGSYDVRRNRRERWEARYRRAGGYIDGEARNRNTKRCMRGVGVGEVKSSERIPHTTQSCWCEIGRHVPRVSHVHMPFAPSSFVLHR